MENTNAPDPDDTLTELAPLFPVFYQALEGGILDAQQFFDERGAAPEWTLYAAIVRWDAKQYLESTGHSVMDEECDQTYAEEDVPNNGLCVTFAGYRIRILKSNDGTLPPGLSKSRQAFYRQIHQWTLFGDDLVPTPAEEGTEPINLVVLWRVAQNKGLDDLVLVCPKGCDQEGRHVEEHWRRLIPHAALAVGGGHTPGVEIGAVEDLEITLPNQAPAAGDESE